MRTTSPSEQQRHAIEEVAGPCLILAGPGSGKTYVLTHRIAHLIKDKNVQPWEILALTFTNKAAREMNERIQELIDTSFKNLWIGTFHSLFSRMLRIEAAHIGLIPDFTIYDSEDSKKLIKKIIKELSLSDEIYKPKVVLNRISGAKNRLLLDAKGYAAHPTCQAEDKSVNKPHMAQIFTHYQTRCRRADALDFDDILLLTYHMLCDNPEIAEKYQTRFTHILIDEFQDTNTLQYKIIKILTQKHGSLYAIGDDAQAIYAFRGADYTHMLNFKKDFPHAQQIKLTHNFRSTQHIVNAANMLIKHNKAQLKKELFTENPEGHPIQLIQHRDDLEEGIQVARNIFETSQKTKAPYSHFAVLYRANRQSRIIEESLRKIGIPYVVRGGTSFYTRKEVRDLLAYLRLLINPNDEQAIERVINHPKRGIGATTMAKVHKWSLDHNITLWEGLTQSEAFLTPRIAHAINGFTSLINEHRRRINSEDAYTLAKSIAEKSGLSKALYDEKNIEAVGRFENLQELLSGIDHFVTHQPQDKRDLATYLQEVALMTGDEGADDKPSVTLMTIHAAKGLEYDYVYLVGIEEDILPSSLMRDTQKGIEEERRLFYVAITRAKQRLTLNYAMMRKTFENYKRAAPSRFIGEIEEGVIHHKQQRSAYTDYSHRRDKRQYTKKKESYKEESKPTTSFSSKKLVPITKHQTQERSASTSTKSFNLQTEVVHPQFGKGTIVESTQTAHGQRVVVAFKEHGNKTLLTRFAKLAVVPDE